MTMDAITQALVEQQLKDTPGMGMHQMMTAANSIADSNQRSKPFSEVDIRFAEFVDFMRKNATQREKDLVFISEHLQRVWMKLHIGVQLMQESMSESDNTSAQILMQSLQRLGLEHLLTEGLKPKGKKALKAALDAAIKETP